MTRLYAEQITINIVLSHSIILTFTVMEDWAETITKHLSSFVEILAAIVIGIALLPFLYQYIKNLAKPNIETENQKVRIQFEVH